MKKIVFAVSLFAAFVMTACTPETLNEQIGIPEDAILLSSERFSGHGDKTSVEDLSVKWVNGDYVYLYDVDDNGDMYEVKVVGDNAYVNDALTSIRNNAAYGYYGVTGTPTWNSSETKLTVTVPSEYTSSYEGGRQVIALPMVAYKSGAANKIEFKHVTAAVKVRVKNSTANVLFLDRVIVSSDEKKLSGDVELTLTEGDLGLVPASGSGSVEVTFSSASIAVGEICEVQVPILPISEGNLRISVYTHNADITGLPITGLTHTFDATKTVPDLARNVMLTAQVKIDPVSANVVSKGTFSVSADKAVYFSMGNLKYSRTSTSDEWSTGTWSFMTNQYDVVETANVSANYGNETAIGLFGYGTSGYNNGQTCFQPWSTSRTVSDYYTGDLSGTSADWGYNKITNGGNTENSGWRTLTGNTGGEWNYIMVTRTTHTSGLPTGSSGDNSAAHYLSATVAGKKGLVVFPDHYAHPADATISGTIYYDGADKNGTGYKAIIAADSWIKMAAAGAIFLPVTSMRRSASGDNIACTTYSNEGYYRGANASPVNYTYGLKFVTSDSSPMSYLVYAYNNTSGIGMAVRLVRNAN